MIKVLEHLELFVQDWNIRNFCDFFRQTIQTVINACMCKILVNPRTKVKHLTISCSEHNMQRLFVKVFRSGQWQSSLEKAVTVYRRGSSRHTSKTHRQVAGIREHQREIMVASLNKKFPRYCNRSE